MDMRRQQHTIEVMATPAAAMQALMAQYAAVRAADRRAGRGAAGPAPRAPHTPYPAAGRAGTPQGAGTGTAKRPLQGGVAESRSRAAAVAVQRRQREADRVVVHFGAQPRVRVLGRAPVVVATVVARPLVIAAAAAVRGPPHVTGAPGNAFSSDDLAAAVADTRRANERYLPADLAGRPSAAPTIARAELERRDLVHELLRLIQLLPPAAILHACGATRAGAASLTAKRAVDHIVERVGWRWKSSTVRDVVQAWARFLAWLSRRDIDASLPVAGVDSADFLASVGAQAVANAQRLAAAKAAQRPVAPSLTQALAATPAPGALPAPPAPRVRDGSRAEAGVKDKLKFVARHFGLDLGLAAAGLSIRGSGVAPPPTQPTPSLTAGMVWRLEAFGLDARVPIFYRQVALAVVFCALSCNRCEQAQSCCLGDIKGGVLYGTLVLDKHPNPDKRRPRPFWMHVQGVTGRGHAWLEALLATLAGVEGGRFVFRGTDSVSGDPARATRFVNSPMTQSQVLFAIRATLAAACEMAPDVAGLYGLHSARHLLPEAVVGFPALEGVEVGRWSGSTAQDTSLAPAAQLLLAHTARVGVLPAHYAHEAKVARVIGILSRAASLLRNACAVDERAPPPVFGGWDRFV